MNPYADDDDDDGSVAPPAPPISPPSRPPSGPPPPRPPGAPPSRPEGPPPGKPGGPPPSKPSAPPSMPKNTTDDEETNEPSKPVASPPPKPAVPPSTPQKSSESDEEPDVPITPAVPPPPIPRSSNPRTPQDKYAAETPGKTPAKPPKAHDFTPHYKETETGTKLEEKNPFHENQEEVKLSEVAIDSAIRVTGDKHDNNDFISTTKQHVEIPREMIQRLLLKDEAVIGQFDTFYPTRDYSLRTKFLLVLLTAGFYLVVMLAQWIAGAVKRAICQCHACEDEKYLHRGKLMVTNMGRLFCWKLTAAEKPQQDHKTHYAVASVTHVMNVEDIAQLNLMFSNRLLCLNCCCAEYSTGIELVFNGFDHCPSPRSKFVSTAHAGQYLWDMGYLIRGSVVYNLYQRMVYGQQDKLVLHLVSNPMDTMYDGEYGLQPLEDLCKFNQQVCEVLSNRRPYVPHPPSAVKDQERRASGIPKGINANHQVFLSAREAADVEVQKTYGTENIHLHGVKDVYMDLSNFALVDEDGNVTIPAKWLPLAPDEEIVSAVGQFYKMSCFEVFLSVLTLGWFYLRFVRHKLMERSAVILTTHRVTEIMLFQRFGKVPAELGGFDMNVRSYFPKQVHAGYIRSADGKRIDSSVVTPHGQLTVSVPASQLIFAQKMHLVAGRDVPLDLQDVHKLLPDLSHLIPPEAGNYANGAEGEAAGSSVAMPVRNSARIKYDDTQFAPLDNILLPLMPNETLVHRFQGGADFKSCCLLDFGCFKAFLCNFAGMSPNAVPTCSAVGLVRLLTCWSRPLLDTPSCVITNHSLFYISATSSKATELMNAQTFGSNRSAGCCNGTMYQVEPFVLTWVPIRDLKHQSMEINNIGAFPYAKFYCCTLPAVSTAARYKLLINTQTGVSYPLSEDIPYRSWIKDARLSKMQDVLGAVQVAISKE